MYSFLLSYLSHSRGPRRHLCTIMLLIYFFTGFSFIVLTLSPHLHINKWSESGYYAVSTAGTFTGDQEPFEELRNITWNSLLYDGPCFGGSTSQWFVRLNVADSSITGICNIRKRVDILSCSLALKTQLCCQIPDIKPDFLIISHSADRMFWREMLCSFQSSFLLCTSPFLSLTF